MNLRRNAFTIVEPVVVVGVIAVTTAILVPAIQYARENSRRTHCVANLRQLGVALHSYHDSFQALPPSLIWSPAGEPLGGGRYPIGVIDAVTLGAPASEDRLFSNWVVMLLPFLEERALSAQFDWRFSVSSPANETARSTELEIMKCPTDAFNGADNHFQRSFLTSDAGYARGNYALNLGTNRSCLNGEPGCKDGFSFEGTNLSTDNRRVWGSGIGGANHSTRFREFPNGLSKTVAVEEIRAGIVPIDRRGAWSLGFVGCSVTSCHGQNAHKGPNRGADFIQGCPKLQARCANQLLAENMPCSFRKIPIEISEKATARSMHAGGINLLMADGSVHFVDDSVDSSVWHMMHRRDAVATAKMPF